MANPKKAIKYYLTTLQNEIHTNLFSTLITTLRLTLYAKNILVSS